MIKSNICCLWNIAVFFFSVNISCFVFCCCSEADVCRTDLEYRADKQNEPRQEKTCLRGWRPGKTQTGLLSYRDELES